LQGETEAAIALGEESLAIGKRAPAQPTLVKVWSNLTCAHIVRGEIDKALEYFAAWQQWIEDGRSWAAKMEYYCDMASMELVFGNTDEALRLIAAVERDARGADYLVINQGIRERLRVLAALHTQGAEPALRLASQFMDRFRGQHTLAYIDALAAMAWTEKQATGKYSPRTVGELGLFDHYNLHGKRRILIAEGYLDRLD
jgi:hypothetical protein